MGAGVTALNFFVASTAVQEFFRITRSSTLSALFVVMTPALENKRSDCACDEGIASIRQASIRSSLALVAYHMSGSRQITWSDSFVVDVANNVGRPLKTSTS